MSNIVLYIAASIDGFIAREDGGLDWLTEMDNPTQCDHGYNDLLDSIEATIMGYKTYEVILGMPMEFPYSNLKNYIVTRHTDRTFSTPDTHLLNSLSAESITRIKQEAKKDIWLIGGGEIVTQFLNLGMVDKMIISIVPVILGEGIPLFPNHPKESEWKLTKTESFDTGIASLTYIKK